MFYVTTKMVCRKRKEKGGKIRIYLKLRKMSLPKIIRDLEGGDAEFLRQQPVPVVRILHFGDHQLPPELGLGVLAALRRRRRIPFLPPVSRQLVDSVVRFRELTAGQHRGKIVLRQPKVEEEVFKYSSFLLQNLRFPIKEITLKNTV